MKQEKKSDQKLQLNKMTIVRLNQQQLKNVQAGDLTIILQSIDLDGDTNCTGTVSFTCTTILETK
jgi:hypothetical protein